MLFKIERVTDKRLLPAVLKEISTLEELLEFVRGVNESVIIMEGSWQTPEAEWTLEIYDDYRE